MSLAVSHRRFTVEEYHRMAEAGILREDDRVELIGGEIVEMTPIGLRHAACVDKLTHLLVSRAGKTAIVHVQNPVELAHDSEPQPDVSLLRPRSDFYSSRRPRSEDVLLVVEVADTSLGFDRSVKVPLYARSGVPEVWIVDLESERVQVFRHPRGGVYATELALARGDVLRLPEARGGEVRVDEILL